MAIAAGEYYSNAIVGSMNVGADVNLLAVDANPKYPIGQLIQRADGNIYHYGYSSSGVAAGTLVAPTFASSGQSAITRGTYGPTSSTAVAGDAIQPCAKGSRFVELDGTNVTALASATANLYRGGYFITSSGSGTGYTYRIKGNTAYGNPVSAHLRIELKEPLQYQVNATTVWMIVPCMWNDLIAADVATNTSVSGVSMGTTTSTYPYGWFCTRGIVGVVQTGTITAGQAVMLSTATSGTVAAFGIGASQATSFIGQDSIGQCLQPANATGGLCTIFLSSID